MAMIQREPLSFHGVTQMYIEGLGYKHAGRVAKLSKTRLYLAADERGGAKLTDIWQYVELDVAYFEKHGEKPLVSLLDSYVEQRAASRQRVKDMEIAFLDVGAAVGLVQHAASQAKCPNGDGGKRTTENERRQLIRQLIDLKAAADKAILSVNADCGINVVSLSVDGKVK